MQTNQDGSTYGSTQIMEQLEFKFKQSLSGKDNPNYKNGRSKNHYYYTERSRAKHREKHNVRNKVYRALRAGKLIPQPCSFCGNFKSEFHHEDYQQPLAGIWLCRKHHVFADQLLREGFYLKDFIILCFLYLNQIKKQ